MGDNASESGRRLERAIEATWLAALVVTPLLFSSHAGDSFELHKVAALRSLALVAAALATARWLQRRGDSSRPDRLVVSRRSLRPWIALAVAHVAIQGLATAASIDRDSSLWGSSMRYQGLATELAYVAFFLLLLRWIGERRQLESVVDAALLASLPVALYGTVQRFGTDPIPWADDVSARVTSTLGNPIFLGAFLILVVPLALYRHQSAARALAEGESAALKAVLAGGAGASLLFQIAAWSLGPVSGTLAAAVTLAFWCLEAKLLQKPLSASARIGAYNVILSAQIAALLLSGSRGPMLGLGAGIGFFLLLWSIGRGRLRLALAFSGLAAAALAALAVANMEASPLRFARELPYVGRLGEVFDRTGRVRLDIWEASGRALAAEPERIWTGFGPETLQLALTPHFTPEPGGGGRQRGALPDRAHNEPVQRLLTSGVAGLAVHLSWVTALVACGMGSARALSRRSLPAFLLLWLAGGASGALLARALDGSFRLAGPAVALGMLGGAFAYLAGLALVRLSKPRRSRGRPWSERRLLAAALASALVAHVVELQFGIAVTATRLHFWAFAACLIVAAGGRRLRDREPARGRALAVRTGLVTLGLGTLAYDFTAWAPERLLQPSVVWIVSCTWLAGGVLVLATGALRPWTSTLLRYGFVTLVPLLALSTVQYLWIGESPDVPEPFWAFVLLWVGALAALARPSRVVDFSGAGGLAVAISVVALALLLVFGPVLDAVRADVDFGQARLSRLRGALEPAERHARLAVERRPNRGTYLVELGRILLERAMASPDGDARFAEAATTLGRAAARAPLDPRHPAALSQVYAAWADRTEDPDLREARFERAFELNDAAIERFPTNPVFWNERAVTLVLAGETDPAMEALEHSLRLDEGAVSTHLRLAELKRATGALAEAADIYERALTKTPSSIETLRALASLRVAMDQPDEAARALARLVEIHPDDAAAHLDLALLLDAAGDRARARSHAELALEHAPPREREAFKALLSSVRNGAPE